MANILSKILLIIILANILSITHATVLYLQLQNRQKIYIPKIQEIKTIDYEERECDITDCPACSE